MSATTVTWLFLLSALGLGLAALPLIAGRVPPNRWYGFRVPRTLADPQVWYPANAYAGKLLLAHALLLAAATLLLPRLWPELSADAYAWWLTAVLVGGLLLVLVLSLRHLNAL